MSDRLLRVREEFRSLADQERLTHIRFLDGLNQVDSSIAENSRDMIARVDRDGRYLYVNPVVAELGGLPREAFIGKLIGETRIAAGILGDDHTVAPLRAVVREAVETGTSQRCIINAADGPGGLAFDFSVTPERDETGQVTSVLYIARDVTELKRNAAELQIEIDQRKEAEYRSARLCRVATVLSAINSLVVRVRDADELYREACRIAVDIGMFTKAWIGLIDPESKRMEIVAAVGDDERYFVQLLPLLANGFREGHVLFDGVMKEQRPVVLNDIEPDPGLTIKDVTLASGSRALVWLPLITAGETAGVFALHAGEAGFFDHEELKLLQELAGDVAFARNHIAQAQRLDYLAYYDSLTDLANGGLFHDRLEQYVSASSLARDKLALVLLDLSRFKTINDTLGRHAGDSLLKQVAGRLRACVQDATQLARVGADHFAVVIPSVKGESDAMRMFDECYQQCFSEPFLLDGETFRVSAVGGIALYPNDALTAELLNGNAEAALRRAKGGRDRVLFYNQRMSDAVAEKLALENQLRQALDRDQFVLHYQPKVDLETGRVEGVEALIRWNSPDLGLVPPEQFIPLMEETGLIVEVGYWILCRAALDHEAWLAQGLPAPRIAVNVSAVQLRKQDFAALVEDVLSRGAAPGIDIEITESLLMEDIDASVEKLHALRQLGVNVAIDDFGTGYSSLAYLAKLPAQILKIDRTFISTMLREPDVMTLVSTMITLAHALRLKVVAEGVETADESTALRNLGCDQIQGYLVSRPMSFAAMSTFIRDEASGRPAASASKGTLRQAPCQNFNQPKDESPY